MWFSLIPENRVTLYKLESLASPAGAGAGAVKEVLLLAEMLPEEKTMDFRINRSKTNTVPKLGTEEMFWEGLGGIIVEIRTERRFSICICIMFIPAIVN